MTNLILFLILIVITCSLGTIAYFLYKTTEKLLDLNRTFQVSNVYAKFMAETLKELYETKPQTPVVAEKPKRKYVKKVVDTTTK